MLKLGINNVTNEEYHSDRNYLSSSVLKTILKDPKEYIEVYINGNKKATNNQAALDFGTAAHLLLLEPHLKDEIIFTEFATRAVKQYKEEVVNNPKKLVFPKSDSLKLQALEAAFRNHPHSSILDGCLFEHTIVSMLHDVPVKVRADAINIEKGYIVDVKTTAYSPDPQSFKNVIDMLYYDLSAALYCAVAEQTYNKEFDFYFIVLSKENMQCEIYKASLNTMVHGTQKLSKAMEMYKNYIKLGHFPEEIEDKEIILEI